MKGQIGTSVLLFCLTLVLFCVCSTPVMADSLALVASEGGGSQASIVAALMATGNFSSVTVIDATSSTPTLATLNAFTDVLAWTDAIPADGTALGNVLATYYSEGGHGLTVATYGFSNPWAIGGAITTGDYAGLTNTGTNGSVSGNLVALTPDPIFNGINLATLTYFSNSNFANPGLAPGATLLATDGAGVNMIARSANGVVDLNLYPGDAGAQSDNQQFYNLLANTFVPAPSSTVPEPSTALLLVPSLLALALCCRFVKS